jgi:cyclohexyl-isocyanide hydratase
MRATFVLFPNLTALDFVGIYDPLTRLRSMGFWPDFTWDLCALVPDIADDRGLRLTPTRVGAPLAGYDLLVVPGGAGVRPLLADEAFLGWLRTATAVPLKASVCSGALLLGAAGFLAGRRATTHAGSYADLAPYCAAVARERVVDEGAVVTAGGVTAGIDLGLHLVERLAGADVRARIARQMEYPTAPA